MQSLSDFILQSVPAKTKITNRRQFVISQFVDEINKERLANKLKPFAASYIAFKLSHLKIPDLEYLYSTCIDYKNRKGSFGKCMFGSIKTK